MNTEELKGLAETARTALERLLFLLGTAGISNVATEKEKLAKNPKYDNSSQSFMKVLPLDIDAL